MGTTETISTERARGGSEGKHIEIKLKLGSSVNDAWYMYTSGYF